MAPVRSNARALAAALTLLVGLVVGTAHADETLDRIAAVVNDDIILASELDEEVELARQQLRQQGEQNTSGDLRTEVLDTMVNERLQLQRAREYGISVNDDQVNRALQQLAERNGTDLSGLREQVRSAGIDFDTLRDDIRTQLVLRQVNQRVVASRVNISDEAIDEYLADQDEEDDSDETEYRAEHILIDGDDGAERAAEVVERLRDGADFAEVAAEVSAGPRADEGGDLGWREPDQLPELFRDALETMDEGEISDALESSNGYHILRLAERRGGETVTEARTRHIVVRAEGSDEEAEQAARERAAELRERIAAGESFDEVAAEHSADDDTADEGGDLGWVGPGDVDPAFAEVIDQLETGELSDPFRTEAGWHIAEIRERRETAGDAEQRRRAEAEQELFRERVAERSRDWVQELRDEAFIEERLEADSTGG